METITETMLAASGSTDIRKLKKQTETMAASGTDKEKELAKAIQEADGKYRRDEQRHLDSVENERRKREDERERFDRERNHAKDELMRIKDEHSYGFD